MEEDKKFEFDPLEKRDGENEGNEGAECVESIDDVIPQDEIEAFDEMEICRSIPVIPLRGLTAYPCMVLHFDIGREKSITALEKAMVSNQLVLLCSQKEADTELPGREDFYHIGTVAKIKQMLRLPGDTIRVLVEGLNRGEIEEFLFDDPYFKARVREIEDREYEEMPLHMTALMRSVLSLFEEYLEQDSKSSNEAYDSVASVEQPGQLADAIASHIDFKTEDKQAILEAFDEEKRLELLGRILSKEIEIRSIENDISSKVREQINQNQKEYYLREQMRAIQSELGQDDEAGDSEADEWLEKMKDIPLPEEVAEKVKKEISKFRKMQASSAESGVIRNYVECILELPWGKETEDNLDLEKAKEILDEDHYGLDKVKERVLEYLAVVRLSNSLRGPILCLVGPPGTGKTSIAKSVARSLDRKFVRMSLGGVRDEAEIRGHRRTYIGAIPGRIISAVKDAQSCNPVFLFDEVDKIGADFRGDPASALLEVLDPEQNKDFKDHYLDVPFDLSKVMFITTANTTDTIPRPLLDRMEVIEVSGYTEEEKVQIAKQYLIKKQLKENGLSADNLSISESGVRTIINNYTRESGVRNLEREIGSICRKAALRVAKGETKKITVGAASVPTYLGKKRFHYDVVEGENEVGVVTGLAWTIVGGDTLSIETTVMKGTGQLVLTGQLGDVMQESAKAGVSYIRSQAERLGIESDFYKEKDVHIHIPEGATPKDGPSAGVTMCISVISALTGIPVRKDLAMTGEITLRGKVLPVGGIREKVLAAHRAGIRTVLLPKENAPDIDEIPANVRKRMEFVLIENVDQALEQALVR